MGAKENTSKKNEKEEVSFPIFRKDRGEESKTDKINQT